ncbi:hypothetical protein MRB53_014372 [Persea americana]|uniref:Uncharacterized protein n=1 Tax=Persea americana TaxID=3435 RepID=A0ACC2KB10_PERAE|nr:hypothetical protein MRB53_014372 [Persea americana]
MEYKSSMSDEELSSSGEDDLEDEFANMAGQGRQRHRSTVRQSQRAASQSKVPERAASQSTIPKHTPVNWKSAPECVQT